MIIWLNGTFGVGKTTTAELLKDRASNCRIFDPEHMGHGLLAWRAGSTARGSSSLAPRVSAAAARSGGGPCRSNICEFPVKPDGDKKGRL